MIDSFRRIAVPLTSPRAQTTLTGEPIDNDQYRPRTVVNRPEPGIRKYLLEASGNGVDDRPIEHICEIPRAPAIDFDGRLGI